MNIIEEIVKKEPVEDVLTAFSLKFGFQTIDGMYIRYNRDVVLSGELFSVYQRLISEGVLAYGGEPNLVKGPSWKEPAFMQDEKYSRSGKE
ncbi:immunity protein [Pseudomonas syringae]|nr:immunity protein [Pseudomonas syringae]MBD8791792.1 immunity protein [Pseudomonas syringae]MBD8801152.1 immunity protein [Pseudomonas syringae]MBD8810556.1 immunity protein [Pseudomonas syringae]